MKNRGKHWIVMVSVGMYKFPQPKTIQRVWQLMAHFHALGLPYTCVSCNPTGSDLHAMRTEVAQAACETVGCRYLCCIDDDMDFPVGPGYGSSKMGFNPLARMISLNKDMVGTLAFSRDKTLQPFVGYENERGTCRIERRPEVLLSAEPFKVDFVGFGMVVIKTAAIKRTVERVGGNYQALFNKENSWCIDQELKGQAVLAMRRYKAGEIDEDALMAEINHLRDMGENISEDYSFCRKFRQAGHEIWCDPSFDVLHYGNYGYGRLDWQGRYELEKQQEEQDARPSS